MSKKLNESADRSTIFNGAAPECLHCSSRRWRRGIGQLLEARRYAADCGLGVWDFAVEVASLRSAGLSCNDLRWLIEKGYVEHAIETGRGDKCRGRRFHRFGAASFEPRSCLVLTDAGAAAARFLTKPHSKSPVAAEPRKAVASTVKKPAPHWDVVGRVLRVGSIIVKRFTVPATNQDVVLEAFQAQGWPECIDDPLPPSDEIDPKRRIHNTIIRLNRSHERRLIRFAGNGKGRGIRWRRIGDRHRIDTAAAPHRV